MSNSKPKTSSKKRVAESKLTKSDSKLRVEDDFDLEYSSEMKGILSALQQIKEKTQKDGQKKSEETISSVSSDIKAAIEELKSKVEKDSQNFAKSISKISKECETCLKIETAKFQDIYDRFSKEKEAHIQAIKDTISKFEEDKKNLFKRYEQLRKKEKLMISEQEKACADKLAKLEESLKKKKQDDRTLSLLKKTLGTFLGDGSDDEFLADD